MALLYAATLLAFCWYVNPCAILPKVCPVALSSLDDPVLPVCAPSACKDGKTVLLTACWVCVANELLSALTSGL